MTSSCKEPGRRNSNKQTSKDLKITKVRKYSLVQSLEVFTFIFTSRLSDYQQCAFFRCSLKPLNEADQFMRSAPSSALLLRYFQVPSKYFQVPCCDLDSPARYWARSQDLTTPTSMPPHELSFNKSKISRRTICIFRAVKKVIRNHVLGRHLASSVDQLLIISC